MRFELCTHDLKWSQIAADNFKTLFKVSLAIHGGCIPK